LNFYYFIPALLILKTGGLFNSFKLLAEISGGENLQNADWLIGQKLVKQTRKYSKWVD
jgi:hypothetical protein